jgi:hypothetical protein
MNGWQDIATAPRDGTPFDVWEPSDHGGFRVADCWFGANGRLYRHQLAAVFGRWPTHWMPLPKGPSA